MTTIDPQKLALALGVPLFQTPFFLPDYPDGQWGQWRLTHTGLVIDHGYYTRQWLISRMPVLMRRNKQNPEVWETWMSLTPHEIESQEPGCLFAAGHTVIMGLGLGWIALNAALNPAVSRVTVVELDKDVIDFFTASQALAQVPSQAQAKIRLVHDDALAWQPAEPVDFLFADIWRTLAEPNVLEEVRTMQRQIKAGTIYYWGQELTLYVVFQRLFGNQRPLGLEELERCLAEEIELPLLLPRDYGYPRRIEAIIRNRQTRGLPLENR